MFILTTIEDVVAIEPKDFNKSSHEALADNVNERYANKIIPNVGLCICFFDLLKASDGMIGHGRGSAYVTATFRLIIFRPFRGEILEGKIRGASPDGIDISLGFFDDVYIKGPENLFKDGTCHFDKDEKVWIWTTEEGQALYFDKENRVRFRVEQELWTDLAPTDQPPKLTNSGDAAPPGPRVTQISDEKGNVQKNVNPDTMTAAEKAKMRSYKLSGSMQQGGLGCVDWW